MNDDPNSVADALDEVRNSLMGEWWFDEAEATEATGIIFAALTAAGYEVVPAGTADRRGSDWFSGYQDAIERADAAEARLAALLDAIGDPDELADLTTLHPAWAHVELLRRIAAAVQPPDTNQPTRRMQ